MLRTKPKVFVGALLSVAVAQALATGESFAHSMTAGIARLPGRSIAVAPPKLSPGPGRGLTRVTLDVMLDSTSAQSLDVTRSDFVLSADGDMFGAQGWSSARSRVAIAPRHSRVFRLTFAVPSAAVERAALSYRPVRGGISGVVPLNRSLRSASAASSYSTAQQHTFWLTGGVGDPWGTAIDGSGNIWFAEPGCDFNPSCAASTPPGQIGEFNPSTGAVTFYRLPNISGNQPIFVAFDGSGNLWFTTPNNSMIGEFRPSSGTFVGQWPVTGGSGPWDLTVAGGKIWYTEHLVSAVGSLDPSTHAHQDFQTPSANSHPYGIAANGSSVWFAENNSSVDRIGVLNIGTDAISEYQIVQPLGNSTPHLISIDTNGHPWWTEGWSDTIATLNPTVATPGACGTTSGTCNGVQRFTAPSSTTCGGSHISGIAFQASANLVWLDNSLTNQVGSFDPTNGTFAMSTLSCSAHPHDGLNLDSAGNVWWDDEFQNALGELAAPPGVPATPPAGPPRPGSGARPVTPSIAHIKAQLLRQLAPFGRGARIAALLRKRGYAFWFNALGRGRVVIDWYYLPKEAKLSGVTPRPLVLATGKATFSKAGPVRLMIKLTAIGKRMLKATNRLKLTAKGTYILVGSPAVTARRTFVLKRR